MAVQNAQSPTQADRDFAIARLFPVGRELVYRAWTEPELMAQWWGPNQFTNPVCLLDVRPGGGWRIVMQGPDGAQHPAKGVYQQVEAPGRLVLTIDHSELSDDWHDRVDPHRDKRLGRPAVEAVTSVTFDEYLAKTTLSLHMRFDSTAVRDALLKLGMREGWRQSLDRLAILLAKLPAPL